MDLWLKRSSPSPLTAALFGGLYLAAIALLVFCQSSLVPLISLILFVGLHLGLRRLSWRFKTYAIKDLHPMRRHSNEYALRFENLDFHQVALNQVRVDDEILCEAGRIVPADGVVVDGLALVDESAITGESAPVMRENSVERRFVTEGTRILTNRILIRVTKPPKLGLATEISELLNSPVKASFGIGIQDSVSRSVWIGRFFCFDRGTFLFCKCI